MKTVTNASEKANLLNSRSICYELKSNLDCERRRNISKRGRKGVLIKINDVFKMTIGNCQEVFPFHRIPLQQF